MLSGIASLFTPRSRPIRPPPLAPDASHDAIPLPDGSQPLVTPIQQENENSDAEDDEAEDDTPQPKLVDAKNYESPTIAKARRLSTEHARPLTREGPAPTANEAPQVSRDPPEIRANSKKTRGPSQTRSTAQPTRRERAAGVEPADGARVSGEDASSIATNGRKRKIEAAPNPLGEKLAKRRWGSGKSPVLDGVADDNDSSPYEASTTVEDYCYSVHVMPSATRVPAWEQLPRTHHVKRDGHTYRERDAVRIEVGDGEEEQEEAIGLVLEIRREHALVAWYYTPENAKARRRPTAWAKKGKTHIISSHMDIISTEAFYGSPLSAKQRSHLEEDKVLNLADTKGRTPRLTSDMNACVLARALR